MCTFKDEIGLDWKEKFVSLNLTCVDSYIFLKLVLSTNKLCVEQHILVKYRVMTLVLASCHYKSIKGKHKHTKDFEIRVIMFGLE